MYTYTYIYVYTHTHIYIYIHIISHSHRTSCRTTSRKGGHFGFGTLLRFGFWGFLLPAPGFGRWWKCHEELVLAEVALALARNRQAPGQLNTLKLSMFGPFSILIPLVSADPPGAPWTMGCMQIQGRHHFISSPSSSALSSSSFVPTISSLRYSIGSVLLAFVPSHWPKFGSSRLVFSWSQARWAGLKLRLALLSSNTKTMRWHGLYALIFVKSLLERE